MREFTNSAHICIPNSYLYYSPFYRISHIMLSLPSRWRSSWAKNICKFNGGFYFFFFFFWTRLGEMRNFYEIPFKSSKIRFFKNTPIETYQYMFFIDTHTHTRYYFFDYKNTHTLANRYYTVKIWIIRRSGYRLTTSLSPTFKAGISAKQFISV